MHKTERQKSDAYGRWAERLAAIYLRCCGYRIISRREKTPFGEIDLMARRRQAVIFIEVKYRRRKDRLEGSLTPKSQNRILKAAHYITSRTPEFQKLEQRFDLIFMAPLGPFSLGYIRHIKDAWRTY